MCAVDAAPLIILLPPTMVGKRTLRGGGSTGGGQVTISHVLCFFSGKPVESVGKPCPLHPYKTFSNGDCRWTTVCQGGLATPRSAISGRAVRSFVEGWGEKGGTT